jgi:S-DNA-T family DNA segregation ATPase FtsK/SpoIIIE
MEPAALEIDRPRLPWWTLLPLWAQLVLLPVALVWFLGWLTVHLTRVVWRYPLTVAVLIVAWWLYVHCGRWWLLGIVAGVAGALAVWWWRHRSSFGRFVVPQARTEWRRLTVYGRQWRTVMRLSDLTKSARGKEYRPALGLVRSEGWRDRVRIRMIKGQAPQHWENHAEGLAHSFHADSCRVRVVTPGRIELDLIHRDPLIAPIPVPMLADDGTTVDLKRITVGRTETGKPWRIRLLGTHLLAVGVSGAGKGSLLWSIIWQLAPAIRAGKVRLVGIDPKGGMELGQAPDLFDKVVFDNGPDAVELLEELAGYVRERASKYRGWLRNWTAETGDPFTLLVVDELADVIAYQSDKQLRERAARAVQTITSQGRAPGVCVLGLLQDPRKEVVSFRHLFSTRIAMRLDETAQVDMVLGDGVRQRGANAHEISEHTPGVAWVKEDGKREPVRARAFHVTDHNLAVLEAHVTGRRARVYPFPGPARGGEAA